MRSFGLVSAAQIWDGRIKGVANAVEDARKERRDGFVACFMHPLNSFSDGLAI